MTAPQIQESEIRAQRIRVAELKTKLLKLADRNDAARDLLSVVDHLVRRSIWIVGGDGWAYDIGYGGLDHVLATGRNVNVLVLDTEVYSNTGGQASKATPLGAIAKFAAAGKRVARKDLALQAIAYGNVYVAQVAMGANPQQTLQAFREAEAYEGPSLILAYSHCIAHGFDLRNGMKQQDLAVASGYWPLFRYVPAMRKIGESPFRLDSPRPTVPFKDYAYNELRYYALALTRPTEAAELLAPGPGRRQGKISNLRGICEPSRRADARAGHNRGGEGVGKEMTGIERNDGPMDLTTRYLGLNLKNPIVAGAGPVTSDLHNIRRLEEFGAAAVVLPSIFEEQIEQEKQLIENMEAMGVDSYPEALTYFPPSESYGVGPTQYLETLYRASKAVDIPIVASLNGTTDRGWIDYARQIEQAGADALELNIYLIPTSPEITGREVEDRYISILRAVKQTVKIPVAVKLGPYFSAVAHMATQLADAGADGLVFFNRFYQPDIDLGHLTLLPNLELSTAKEIRLPLLWIGVMAGKTRASLAASTGVESADEVIKYLLAGADVVMTTSAILRHGVSYIKVLLDSLEAGSPYAISTRSTASADA